MVFLATWLKMLGHGLLRLARRCISSKDTTYRLVPLPVWESQSPLLLAVLVSRSPLLWQCWYIGLRFFWWC